MPGERTGILGLTYTSDGGMNRNLDRLDGLGGALIAPSPGKVLAPNQPARIISGSTQTITTTEVSFGTIFINRANMAFPEAQVTIDIAVCYNNASAGAWANANCEVYAKLDGVKMGNNKSVTIPSVPVGLTIFPHRTIVPVTPPASGDGALTVWAVTNATPPASCTITVLDQVVAWITWMAWR